MRRFTVLYGLFFQAYVTARFPEEAVEKQVAYDRAMWPGMTIITPRAIDERSR